MKRTRLYYLCEHVFPLKGYSVRGILHRQRKKVKRRRRCHRRQCGIPLRKLNKCTFDTLPSPASLAHLHLTTGSAVVPFCCILFLALLIWKKHNMCEIPPLPPFAGLLPRCLASVTSMTPPPPPPSLLPPGRCAGRLSWCWRKGGLEVQKGLIGDLELPPVADPQLQICPLELHVWTVGGIEAAHTERRLCSCRLMQWLIDPEPLYSFTSGFEIQHCTWGAMCVPSLSPFINLSLYLPFLGLALPPVQTFCISDFMCRLIALDVTCRRWALLTRLPQVPIYTLRFSFQLLSRG